MSNRPSDETRDLAVEKDSAPSVPTHVALRPLYLVLGLACVGIGSINFFIPGMPSTVFYLIALWAFKRSSPRLEHWILWRSPVGPALRDWERDRSIALRTKIVAILFVWLGIGASIAILLARHRPLWISGLLFVIALILTWFLASRKTKRVP
ncbi:MAG: YbaN family protein [Fimbriimonas sp.]